MFERLSTPQEALNFKQDEKVKELLRAHRGESERHVSNVEEAFGLFYENC